MPSQLNDTIYLESCIAEIESDPRFTSHPEYEVVRNKVMKALEGEYDYISVWEDVEYLRSFLYIR